MPRRFEVGAAEELCRLAGDLQEPAEIVLGAGTYAVDGPVEFNQAVVLIGAGVDQTTITCSALGTVVRFVAGPSMARGIHFVHEGDLAGNVLVAAAACDFRSCRFSGGVAGELPNAGTGLCIMGGAPGRVINCESDNNAVGILIISANPVTVQGSWIHHNGKNGIEEFNTNCTIRRNRCENNAGLGILAGDCSGTMSDNEIKENAAGGIRVFGKGGVHVEGNVVTGSREEAGIAWKGEVSGAIVRNRCEANHTGIMIRDAASPRVEGNEVVGNLHAGIGMWEGATPQIRGNRVVSNGFYGIEVRDQTAPSIEENAIEANERFGIVYFESAGGYATGNTCRANKGTGILVDESAQVELNSNHSIGNERHGIFVDGAARVTSRGNRCEESGGYGFLISGTAVANLSGDQMRGTCVSGLAWEGSASGTAEKVESSGNQYYGVYATGSGALTFVGVICEQNTKGGFIVRENRSLRMANCIARRNQGDGIDLGAVTNLEVEGCVAEENGECGIVAYDSCTLRRNRAIANAKSGIVLSGAVSGVIEENAATGNLNNGIAFVGDATGVVRANVCERNQNNGIVVWDRSSPRLIRNECTENGKVGILATEEAKPTVEANICRRNKAGGIAFDGTASGEITGNTVEDNLAPGIHVREASRPLVRGNRVFRNVKYGIVIDPGAKAQVENNVEGDNNRPGPNEWALVGSRNGRHFEYKQFAARAAAPVELPALLERAARTLRQMGWKVTSTEMRRHAESGGYFAEFSCEYQGGGLSLSALSLNYTGAPELNLTFSDSDMVMWRQQQAEHIVGQTLYYLSAELRDLTQTLNPWVAVYGDWSNDMVLRDSAGRFYQLLSVRQRTS